MPTVTVGQSTFNMPDNYAINPGSVFQTYNPTTGQTTYGDAPAGFASGATGSAPAVVTPTGLPSDASVYQGNGLGFVPLTPQTAFSKGSTGEITSAYARALGITSPSLNAERIYIPNEKVLQQTREELGKLGIPKEEWSKYISSPDASGKIYYTPPTLASTLKNQPPTSAGEVRTGNTVNIGGVEYSLPDISGATGAIAGTQSLIGSEEQLFQQRLEQTKQLQEAKNQANQSMLTKLLGSKSPEQASIDAWQQLGIDPAQHYAQQKAIIAEIESLTKDYNSVVAARDAQLATSQGSMASMNFINNQQAQINRNAAVVLNQKAANINAKTATLEALQGNFASAQTFVNQAVQAAAAQYEYNYNSYKIFKEQNDEMFNALDSVYQDAYNYQLQKAQNEYETKKAEAQQVGNLMLEYPTAGININDTYNDAIVKAQKIAAVEYNKKGTGTGVKPKTFTVGSETINETGDTWTDTVNYLKALKRQGMFSDFSYNQQVNALVQAEGLELNEDNINAMKSRVNNELKKSDIIAPEKTITKPSEKVISEIGRLQPLGTTSPQTTSPMIKETTGGFWSSLFGL